MNRTITRKLICLTLSVLLTVSLAGTCFAKVTVSKYSSWFASNYTEMNQLNLIPDSFSGYDLTADITRGEMCELAVHAYELITKNTIDPERTDYFSDTSDLSVVKAYELGIVSGYPDGTYRPEQYLTRQEFFQIIQNFCNSAAFKPSSDGVTLNHFKDTAAIADWAIEATKICVKCGYVNGTTSAAGPILDPTSNTSRQEAMAMFLRCFKGLNEYYYGLVLSAKVVEDNKTSSSVTVADAQKTMYVSADKLNVRASWSSVSTLLGTLAKGAAVTVTGTCSNGWIRISYNGGTAYVSGDYVSNTQGGSSSGDSSGSGTGTGGSSSGDSGSSDSSGDSGSSGGSSTVDGEGVGVEIANYALTFVGYPYVYGGTSTSGFDCSGLMYYCYKHFGITLNRVADDQMNQGTAISREGLQAGDLVFFGSGSYASHVGMYIGNGNFVHAANPSSGVRISSLNETYYANRYLGARRIITG